MLLWNGQATTILRVRKPRDKGPVEGIVYKFYQFIYAAIRHEAFHSLDELNSRIFELTDKFNDSFRTIWIKLKTDPMYAVSQPMNMYGVQKRFPTFKLLFI